MKQNRIRIFRHSLLCRSTCTHTQKVKRGWLVIRTAVSGMSMYHVSSDRGIFIISGVNLCMGSISFLPCLHPYTLPYTHIAFTWLSTISISFGKYCVELVFENVPYLLWFDFGSTLFCLVGFFLLVVEMNHTLGILGRCTHTDLHSQQVTEIEMDCVLVHKLMITCLHT